MLCVCVHVIFVGLDCHKFSVCISHCTHTPHLCVFTIHILCVRMFNCYNTIHILCVHMFNCDIVTTPHHTVCVCVCVCVGGWGLACVSLVHVCVFLCMLCVCMCVGSATRSADAARVRRRAHATDNSW